CRHGPMVYTHACNLVLAQTLSRNLQQATSEFVNGLQQANANLRARGSYQRSYVDGRNAVSLSLSNINEATGRSEIVNVVTTQLRNGELLYLISLAPENDYYNYQNALQNILRSLQLND